MSLVKGIVAVDPGSNGYICYLDTKFDFIKFISLNETPTYIYSYLKSFFDNGLRNVYVEDVHSIYGSSAKSNFNFGRNVGYIQGLISSTGLITTPIQPKEWQKGIGVVSKGKAIKKEVADIVTKAYPYISKDIIGPRGGLIDGKSDSLGIAHFIKLQENDNETRIN